MVLQRLFKDIRQHPRRAAWLLAGLGSVLLCVLGLYLWPYYHYVLAQRALRRFDFTEAQRRIDRCLRAAPADLDALVLAAQIARRRGDYDIASLHLTTAVRQLGRDSPSIVRERALLRAQHGDFADIEDDLLNIAQADQTETISSLEVLARGYAASYRVQEAMGVLEALVRRAPGHAHALVWRGQGWELLGRDDEALSDYERALGINGELFDAQLRMAVLLDKYGRTREAVGHFEVLRQRQPDNAFVVRGLARCRFDLGEHDEAQRLLDAYPAGHRDCAPILADRARLAFRRGDAVGGEPPARAAIAVDPHDPDAHFALHLCLKAGGRSAEADYHLRHARRLQAEQLAVARLTSQLIAAPRNPSLHCQLGASQGRLGKHPEAVRAFNAALRLDPTHAPARAELARYADSLSRPHSREAP